MKSRIISLLLITREEDTWAILCIISLQLSFLFATKYVFVFRILLSDLLFPKLSKAFWRIDNFDILFVFH